MTYGFDEFFSKTRDAATPWVEFGEIGFEAAEKGFQLQTEILSDAIDLAVDRLKAASAAESPADYVKAQAKLAEDYAARAQKRTQSLLKASTEVQQATAAWAEKVFRQTQSGFEEAVSNVRPAAPKSARKAAA